MKLKLLHFISAIVFMLLSAGCASKPYQTEPSFPQKLMIPVTMLGTIVESIGSGISDIGRLPAWHLKEEKPFNAEQTKEQQEELANFSVKWDRKTDIVINNGGLGAGAYQYQDPVKSILLRVESLVGYSFDWNFSPIIPDIARSLPGGVIVINPNYMAGKSPQAVYITLLHECGHHILGHVSQYNVIGATQPWLLPQMELDADGFAAQKMLEAGFTPQQIVYGALEVFGNSPVSPSPGTHPPGALRIQALRNIVGI